MNLTLCKQTARKLLQVRTSRRRTPTTCVVATSSLRHQTPNSDSTYVATYAYFNYFWTSLLSQPISVWVVRLWRQRRRHHDSKRRLPLLVCRWRHHRRQPRFAIHYPITRAPATLTDWYCFVLFTEGGVSMTSSNELWLEFVSDEVNVNMATGFKLNVAVESEWKIRLFRESFK